MSCSKTPQNLNNNQDIKAIEEQALNGDLISQYNLGIHYLSGNNGYEKDINKAIYWITKAAKGGDSDAQYNLGVIYAEKEYGAIINLNKAKYWYG